MWGTKILVYDCERAQPFYENPRLTIKRTPKDGTSASAVSRRDVTTLNHELQTCKVKH